MLASEETIDVLASSPLYETAPIGPPQPSYLNAAFRIDTRLAPIDLLHVLLAVERRLGRTRHPDLRWVARSIDLDLLWDERGPVAREALVVPHPELVHRRFALTPLLAVAPELAASFQTPMDGLGGPLDPWQRAALIEEGLHTVRVEADAVVDACAIAVSRLAAHQVGDDSIARVVDATPEALARAVSKLASEGFEVGGVTVSDCADEQWSVDVHGSRRGARHARRVGIQATCSDSRAFGVDVSLSSADR